MINTQTDQFKQATQGALQALDSIPRRDNEPIFKEPWEAEVFALSLTLNEQGLFTWKEWAETLSRTILAAQANGDPDLGDTYYLHWLSALEQLVIGKKLADNKQLEDLYKAWDKAARTTRHGQPIELS
ncbi:MAG: nitrile hydratase accessory protein [Granulosicoccus sp.]